jgi:hypothetical protein
MKSKFLAVSAAVLSMAAGSAVAQAPKPTPADAKAFVEQAEAQLAQMNEYAAKAAWVRANFITGHQAGQAGGALQRRGGRPGHRTQAEAAEALSGAAGA